MKSSEKIELEKLVDAYSMTEVIAALEEISFGKEEHVRSTWNDEYLAKAWHRVGVALDKAESVAIAQDIIGI